MTNIFSEGDIFKNPHVNINGSVTNGQYSLNYTFKDHFEKLRTVKINFPLVDLENDINRYGVAKNLFGTFSNLSEEAYQKLIKDRENALMSGFLSVKNQVISPDYNAVVNFYAKKYAKPFADAIQNFLIQDDKNDRFHSVQMAMKLVQDFPYALPNFSKFENKILAGILPPPAMLWAKFGECDTKAVFFAAILTFLLAKEDFVFLLTDGHMLSAIRVESDEAEEISFWTEEQRQKLIVSPNPKFTPLNLGKNWYLPCETAGPARLFWGELIEKQNYTFVQLS